MVFKEGADSQEVMIGRGNSLYENVCLTTIL